MIKNIIPIYRVFNPLGRTSHLNKSHKAQVWAVIQTVFTKTYLGWARSVVWKLQPCNFPRKQPVQKEDGRRAKSKWPRWNFEAIWELEKSISTLTWKGLEQKQILSSQNASHLTATGLPRTTKKPNSRGIQLFSYSNPYSKKERKNRRGEEFGILGTKVPLKYNLYTKTLEVPKALRSFKVPTGIETPITVNQNLKETHSRTLGKGVGKAGCLGK